MIQYEELNIKGVWLITPDKYGDSRGYFSETFHLDEFHERTNTPFFIQDNESLSQKGVLRGMHLQTSYPQSKLVRCVLGRIVDVAVDLRPNSPTFGDFEMVELSNENNQQLYIPKGFAHGFCVLSDMAIVNYKVDDIYSPESECSISPFDEELALPWGEWGVKEEQVLLSEKDKKGISLAEYKRRFQ